MDLHAPRSGPVVVFLGPTLSREKARELLDAVYLPPAVQGSVIAAVRRLEPRAILIVDGGFQSEPAVRHKEILWALNLGVPVVGAASLGALRAAELHPHMKGVGVIYRWYRRFPFAPDDAVAVVHGPPDLRSEPLTHSLIDLRMTFRLAERRGLIGHDVRTALDDSATRLNFRGRTIEQVLSKALLASEGHQAERLPAVLRSVLVDQKRRDAVRAILSMRTDPPCPPRNLRFQPTMAFVRETSCPDLTETAAPTQVGRGSSPKVDTVVRE